LAIFTSVGSLLELGHVVTSTHAFYQMTIINYGRPERLVKMPSSMYITILLDGFIAAVMEVRKVYVT
jgi:hypothetical protein